MRRMRNKIFKVKLYNETDDTLGTYDVLAVDDVEAKKKAMRAFESDDLGEESEVSYYTIERVIIVDVE
jgi:hypothetical protein